MKPLRWYYWLAIWFAAAVPAVVGLFLARQGSAGIARVLYLISLTLASLWLWFGFYLYRRHRWVQRAAVLVVGSQIVTALLFLCLWLNLYDATPWALALAGAWAMAVAFILGITLARFVLSLNSPVFNIARTLIDEAIRMKIALIFIVIVLLLVALLPMFNDPREQLHYRIQTFLDLSLLSVSLFLAVMTVFLACATVSGDIERRQVYMTMTKPLSRARYLLGKWLGIAVLDLVLVAVSGAGIYAYTLIMERQRAINQEDRYAVREQVLTSRQSYFPDTVDPESQKQAVRDRFRKIYSDSNQLQSELGLVDFNKPDQVDHAIKNLPQSTKDTIVNFVVEDWHLIPPRTAQTYSSRVYLFHNISRDTPPVLHIKPKSGPVVGEQISGQPKWDGRIWLSIDTPKGPIANPAPPEESPFLFKIANDTVTEVLVPISYVEANGDLTIRIHNVNPPNYPASIRFEPGQDLQVLAPAGLFEANLARALAVVWAKLAFIAMFGLLAGSLFSFPVACISVGVLLAISHAIADISESLDYFTTVPDGIGPAFTEFFHRLSDGKWWDGFKMIVYAVARVLSIVILNLGKYDPVPFIRDGRIIPTTLWLGHIDAVFPWIHGAILRVAFLGSAISFLVAWYFFRKRELARVTV